MSLRNTKGIIAGIKYKDEVVDTSLDEDNPAKYRPTIYLWGRDKAGVRTRLAVKGFKPYFYCIPSIKSEANEILQMPEIEKYDTVEFGSSLKLLRLQTYVPGQVVKIKRAIQSCLAQAAVREGDVLFELRYLIDQGLRGEMDWYDQSNPTPINEDLNIPLKRVYLDIEVWSERKMTNGKMSSKDYIKCLTAYDNYEKVYHTWYYDKLDLHIPSNSKWQVRWCSTVTDLMREFLIFIRDSDPDVVTGYNVDFDLLCIRQEALRRGLRKEFDYFSALWDLGFTVGGQVTKKHRIRGVDWGRKGLLFDGREVVDILDLIRMISRSQLKAYNLDFVSKKFLGSEEGKITWNGKAIGPIIAEVWKQDPQIVLNYNLHDVELIVKLDEKNDLINFLDMLRKAVGVRLGDAFSNQRMLDTELLRRRKFPLPSKFSNKKNEKESYVGAFVVDPVLGRDTWVIVLDWKSLYPSIIRTFNIDTDTYVVSPDLLPKSKKTYTFGNADSTKSWTFLQEPRGLFPQMLDDFTAWRDDLRAKLEKEKDANQRKLLDTKQEVVKVLSNAAYGSFGYRSRKHSFEVAEAITAFGQKMIKFASDTAIKMGYKVLYGDTDSVFISSGKNNYGETYNAGIQLQDEINSTVSNYVAQFGYTGPQILKINLDKIYSAFFMVAKKRYCGRIIEKSGSVKHDVKGLDTKRSDTSEFAGKLQEKLLETLLDGTHKAALSKQVADQLNGIDILPLTVVGVPSAVAKPLTQYANMPIQKKAAVNSNVFLGTNFDFGSKPFRIYIKTPTRLEMYPKSDSKTDDEKLAIEETLKPLDVIAFDESTVLPSWVHVNYPKILDLTIKPKIDKLLAAMNITWKEISDLLKPELRKPEKIKRVKKSKEKPSFTLDSFMGASK